MVGEGISDKENITLVNKFYGMYTYISAIRKKKLAFSKLLSFYAYT